MTDRQKLEHIIKITKEALNGAMIGYKQGNDIIPCLKPSWDWNKYHYVIYTRFKEQDIICYKTLVRTIKFITPTKYFFEEKSDWIYINQQDKWKIKD